MKGYSEGRRPPRDPHLGAHPISDVEARFGRHREVVVAGTRTRYWVHGPDAAEHVLVAVHGLRGTHDGLGPVAAGLDGVRVVVPDLPGFGDSAPLETRHDVAGYAGWLAAFVAAVAPGAALLGHSFGSVVAGAAVIAGAPVRALVLVGPIVDPPRVARRAGCELAVLGHRIARAVPERFGAALLRHPLVTLGASATLTTTTDPVLRRWIHAEHTRHFGRFADRRVLVEAFTAAVSAGLTERAGGIRIPTLVLTGERDRLAPVAAASRLRHRLAAADLVVLPDTGHLAHYEAPAAVARAVERFLARTADHRADP